MPKTRSAALRGNNDDDDETQTVLVFEKKRKNGAKQLSGSKRQKTESKSSNQQKSKTLKSNKTESANDEIDTKSDQASTTEDEKISDAEMDEVDDDKDEEDQTDEKKDAKSDDEKADEQPAKNSATDAALTSEENQKKAEKSSTGESSNIVEKGVIYFLTRGRVETDDPENVTDLQRTFFVLRPLAKGAKLTDGPVPDEKVSRLIAIPKKVLPKSPSDRFMIFVEKANTKMTELKDEFFKGSEYETNTMGTRHTPPVTLVGEGVYAITVTGRSSHLAYILAIPSELGEVQKDLGIREKGSFLISLKNPTAKGPANTQLPETPDFPKEIMDDFKTLRWIPVQKPEHLNYPNAQLLLIGEGEDDWAKALDAEAANGVTGDPQKELEKLEDQEELRIEHLHGDNTIFDDLRVSQKEYSLKSTW